MANDGKVVIGAKIDDKEIKKDLNGIKKDTRKTFSEMAKESGKSVDEIKKDVAKLAKEYQKQGMNIPNSYKRAYKEMGLYSKEAKNKLVSDQDKISKKSKEESRNTKLHWQKAFDGIKKASAVAIKGTAVAITAVGTAIVGLAASAIKYNTSMEQYQTSFEVMTGSAEKAVEVMENLKKVGASTPFEFEDLAKATQLLMNYGFSADEAQEKLMMLGDISQGSAEKMQRIATAYGQMSSAGKVQLEDIKQMIEFCHAA